MGSPNPDTSRSRCSPTTVALAESQAYGKTTWALPDMPQTSIDRTYASTAEWTLTLKSFTGSDGSVATEPSE